ncbi:hypothetical protein SAMN05421544_1113 [Riemerella columbipharyngis]|uniref:Uncharacterized protein n=1 Tax=Riemerella columbipharyngis TaxID=1071918 RepID=A0A1G7DF87_9FLAO|nr:hypothetical protein SAMN05421544_1113 [Riemerella columbipharyngis]
MEIPREKQYAVFLSGNDTKSGREQRGTVKRELTYL